MAIMHEPSIPECHSACDYYPPSHYEPIYSSMSSEDNMRIIADGIKAAMDRFAGCLASIST